jgi:two-component system CheB/CheR fusion protein
MALQDGGYLFLGRSEAVSGCGELYMPLCANEKIFTHNAGGRAPKDIAIHYHVPPIDGDLAAQQIHSDAPVEEEDDAGALKLDVLEKFLPPCLLVDEQNSIRHIFGDCNNYLRFAAGKGEMNLFSLLVDDLKIAVSTALKTVRDEDRRVAYDSVPVRGMHTAADVALVVSPVSGRDSGNAGYSAILFLERGNPSVPEGAESYDVNEAAAKRISNLENDLSRSQTDLKKTVSELETVNEELQATNEELLTANEELQSSNEELQSVNEELYTVNAEYQEKLSEVTSLNNDISNFLSSTMVGIIFLDEKLQIRRFTEYVSKEFSVMDQDVGRPIRFMDYNFTNIGLTDLCRRVVAQMTPVETNVVSVDSKNYFMRIAPYRTSEKKIVGLVLTFVDTTEQNGVGRPLSEIQLELQRERQANREKDSFLSRISHDVRTPLNAILGTAQLMKLRDGRTPEDLEQLTVIENHGSYLLGIFGDILETSRISAGRVTLHAVPTPEQPFLEKILPLVLPEAERKGITLTESIDLPVGRRLAMDGDHVTRILVNLIGNAIKYTPEGGKVDFTVTSEQLPTGKIRHTYVVADNGAGMSEEFQKRMFEPFEQEVAYRRDHVSGQGLGLYIVKKLVDSMKGTITCVSALDRGTAFTVTLDYEAAQGGTLGDGKTPPQGALRRKRVLICEDQSINAEIARGMLTYFGVESDLAAEGGEGVEKFCTSEPYYYDAVLMDLRMPVMDGRVATIAIRTKDRPDAKTVPILMMTADVFADDRVDLLHAAPAISCISR